MSDFDERVPAPDPASPGTPHADTPRPDTSPPTLGATLPAWPAPDGSGRAFPSFRGPAPVTWRDALVAVAVAAVVAVLGVPLAFLWSAIGPHVAVVMTDAGPLLVDYDTEAFVGGDGSFGAIALGAGIVVGALAWVLRRWRGPAMLVGLAAGAIASSWITWKLGSQFGLDEYRALLRDADVGRGFEQPMKLRAQGLVFLQATVAVIVYVVNAAWSHRPDLGAESTRDADPPTSPAPAFSPVFSSGPSASAAPPAAPAPPATGTASSPPA